MSECVCESVCLHIYHVLCVCECVCVSAYLSCTVCVSAYLSCTVCVCTYVLWTSAGGATGAR